MILRGICLTIIAVEKQ